MAHADGRSPHRGAEGGAGQQKGFAMTTPDHSLIDLDHDAVSVDGPGILSVAAAQSVIADVGRAVNHPDSFNADLLLELAEGVSRL
jgi:hypothetical protein